MSTGSQPVSRQAARLALWFLLVAVWTVALLTPQPALAGREVLPPAATFPAFKTLHLAAYAFLAGTLPWLGLRGGHRWWLIGFLALHAACTELLQRWVPHRTGSLFDVGIDHLGILLGLACTWGAWRSR